MIISLLASALMASAVCAEDAPTGQPTSPVEQPDATVDLTGGSFAVGVGFVWGSGTLQYDGAQHAFKFSGVSVIDAGGAHIKATGDVYHLQNLQDFDGHYTVASAGVTVAGGGSLAVVRNEHGVVIKLHATNEGLRFNFSSEGVRVRLEN
ncbi:MAG: hypothetical protein JO191_02915 [Mycobacteriaceae bacterium]|nr:hypothetical protein [Mycobacteriaceae bacterium]